MNKLIILSANKTNLMWNGIYTRQAHKIS